MLFLEITIMLEKYIPTYLVISFITFTVFRYFQYCYMRDYEGINSSKKLTVDMFNTAGFMFEYCFLIYYGYLTVWYYAVCLFIGSFIIKSILYNLFAKDKKGKLIPFVASLGFFCTPICGGYLIYQILEIRKAIGIE